VIATSIRLDRTSTTPLYRQIYDQIKEAILTGRLPAGTRLPSSRTLAHRLAVGRITVTTAYERLAGEGFAQSRAGAGTSVAVSVPGVRPAGQTAAPPAESERSVRVPQRVTDLLASIDPAAADVVDRVEYDFRFMGEPFAMLEWRRMLARHWSTYDTTRLSSVPNEGDLALRQQIAQHLRTARGARCTAEQILVTNNVEHAVDLVAHLLLDGSDAVAVEDPCLSATQRIFRAHGARVVPVPIDEDGVDPDAVEQLPHGDVRLLCLMPSHQYPTGATLPLARRLRLLDWAARSGSLILEDDQYSEYGDDVPESMQGLDVGQVVLYIGTFQRLVASAVRVAYLVVPPSLVPAARAVQAGIDSGPPPFVQWALTEFMTSGLLTRHQRRIQ
jgi:GntR family transcriptional regulator/MocR family aminotransferase